MSYSVRFVSLGPGDAELITLKALHALQQADIIFCPSTLLKTGKTMSRAATLLNELGIDKSIHLFYLPMSKDRTEAMKVYRQLFQEITQGQKAGKQVSVAVEGDASVYASIHYVLDFLKESGIPVEQIPGIPSFIASGAMAQLHLISQEERLVVIPGNISSQELDMYLKNKHVPVIMKLSQCAGTLRNYMALHPEYDYHYFENVSTPKEYHSCQVEELMKREFPYFSLMIILNEQARRSDNPE